MAYNEGLKDFTAGEDLAKRRLVKQHSTAEQVMYADAGDDYIGITEYGVSSGDPVTVRAVNYPGTREVTAADTFSLAAVLYVADDGKVDDVATGRAIGIALEAATAANDIIEMQPIPGVAYRYVGACTTGYEVGGLSTTGFKVSTASVQAFKAEYSITTQLGAWVHGVKVELTRAADIQPATGGWFGAQFVLNAGSAGYTALNKGTYVIQGVFKGSDTNPNGVDIHVARFETQSAGKVSDICHILANTGTTIVGSLCYIATHVAPGRAMLLLNAQSSTTVPIGLELESGAGSSYTAGIKMGATMTSVFDFTGAVTGVLEDNKAAPTKAGSIAILTPAGAVAYVNYYDGTRA